MKKTEEKLTEQKEREWAEELKKLIAAESEAFAQGTPLPESDANAARRTLGLPEIQAIADEIVQESDAILEDEWKSEEFAFGFDIQPAFGPAAPISPETVPNFEPFEDLEEVEDIQPANENEVVDEENAQKVEAQAGEISMQNEELAPLLEDVLPDATAQQHGQLQFAEIASVQVVEKAPKAPKKKKPANMAEKINTFMQKNESVPCEYVFYANFPNNREREKFLIDKKLNVVKLIVWDGASKIAFAVDTLKVYDVEMVDGKPFVKSGEWSWELKKYLAVDKFLKRFAKCCKNRTKTPGQKVALSNMKEWHKRLNTRVVVEFLDLQKYQNTLDACQSENIKVYQESKKDFDVCLVAQENLSMFLGKF